MKRVAVVTLLAAWAAAGPLLAQEVDERRPAAAEGSVVIECPGGSLRVVGWDRAEVAVSGSVSADARVELTSGERTTHVRVLSESHRRLRASASLEIKVPAASRVAVESFGGGVTVTGVAGAVRAETVNGSIAVEGDSSEVSLESVNGQVTVKGRVARVRAESVNGTVIVSGPGEDVEATTVNGAVLVTGSSGLRRGRLETVNGRLRFQGALAARGTLDMETVSGPVELALAAGTPADFDVYTYSGAIDNQLGPAASRSERHGPHGPGRELTFSTGGGGARITVRTLSGRVRIAGPEQH